MPFLALGDKIPHSILFSHEHFHPLPLKIFGSTCFVHNFSYGLDKLSLSSHKCVFIEWLKYLFGPNFRQVFSNKS